MNADSGVELASLKVASGMVYNQPGGVSAGRPAASVPGHPTRPRRSRG
jgi:hypothetical protein